MGVRELTKYGEKLFGNTAVTEILKPFNNGLVEVPWMKTAQSYIGLKEIHGRKNNRTIMQWAKDLGRNIRQIYTNDEIPWCGLFVAGCMHLNGVKINIRNPLGARNWGKFGYEVTPCYGAVLVFWRGSKSGWKGHVGFYASEDDYYYHVLGGNQSDSVKITKVAKKRLLTARWPIGYEKLHKRNIGRIHKKFDGKISTNEK